MKKIRNVDMVGNILTPSSTQRQNLIDPPTNPSIHQNKSDRNGVNNNNSNNITNKRTMYHQDDTIIFTKEHKLQIATLGCLSEIVGVAKLSWSERREFLLTLREFLRSRF